ncbi:hypothetical protein [Pilimelia columellifera]|uniref:FAD-binding FR-type domain-containing protein n=1 Tax=Pilimelia columellifera subsp. columellifera TaxID=706583 RepID=A0ABP6AWR6_9ACTN
MQGLIQMLRQAVTDAQGPAGATATATAAVVARARGGRLSALLADGPAPGATPLLPALQAGLREGLAAAGGAGAVTRAVLAYLAESAATRASGLGGIPAGGARGATVGPGGLPGAPGPGGGPGEGLVGDSPSAAGLPAGARPVGPAAGSGIGAAGGSGPGEEGPAAGRSGGPGGGAPAGSPVSPGAGGPPAGAPAAPAGAGTGVTSVGAGAAPGSPLPVGPGPPAAAGRGDASAPGVGTALPAPGGDPGGNTRPVVTRTAPSTPSTGVPATPGRATPADLLALLPANPQAQGEQLGRAVSWLADNLGRPHLVATGAAQLGPAAVALGMSPERLDQMGALLADAARAAGAPWTAEARTAWEATSRLVARWVAQGAAASGYEPPFWTATVIDHELRRADLAVIRVRTFLPYPYLAGQVAPVETAHHRDQWRPCWVATAPTGDNVIELHVRAYQEDPVGLALVGRIAAGETVRLRPAAGDLPMAVESGPAGALLLAEDTGVAPMLAILADLRERGDPRPARLIWLPTPGQEPYARDALTALADEHRQVTELDGMVPLAEALAADGPWDGWGVAVAGTPTGVAAMLTAAGFADISTAQTWHVQIGPDD